MTQEQTTIGDVSARLIKLMATLGGDNELMFARGTVEQLQCRAYVQLPGAFNELLGTLELLVQDAQHDREATHREHIKRCNRYDQLATRSTELLDKWAAHSDRLLSENEKLTELCEAQGRLIAELSE